MTNQRLEQAGRVLACMVAGIMLSVTLAQLFFNLQSHVWLDQLFLVLVPAAAIAIGLFYVIPFFKKTLERVVPAARRIVILWALLPALAVSISSLHRSPILVFFSLFILSLLLVVPTASSVQILLEAGGYRRVLGAWLFAVAFSFLLVSFLDDFYTGPIEFILLTLLLQAALSVCGYFLIGRVKRVAGERLLDAIAHGVLFLMLIAFILWLFQTSQRVSLFPVSFFVLNAESRWLYVFCSLLALPWQAWLHIQLKFSGFYNRIKQTKVYAYVSANLAGFSLALTFLILYLLLASVMNDPRFDVDDIYFDADHFNYRIRLTTDTWRDFYWRSVHPFMILLFKPPVDVLSFFLKGNKLWGAYLFTALGGALCVYLAWIFIKSATGNSVHASLTAALLGLSASHLIFGSLIESYIFLAASLLLFFVLLLKDSPLPPLVAASLATIGITHSTFAQNAIALFIVKPNIKQMIRFVASVMVFLVLLTLLNNLLYPDAHPFFFVPSTLQAEQQNLFPLNSLRVQALMRAFFFHNVVAPTPILYDKDIPFIQFRFFKPEIDELSRYVLPIQNVVSWAWLGLLVFAGGLFLWNLKRNPHVRVSIALLGCMALNAGIHLRYGKELFLYTPNWTYALVLFLGLAWGMAANRRWFQAMLLVFLSLLIWNNAILLKTILEVLAAQV